IHDALEITTYSLRTSGIDVAVRLAKDLPPVLADEDQMRQVLTNLIVNARHALQEVDAPRRLRICTTYHRQRNEVVVQVKDNGPGIPPEIRSRVFEPLFTTKEVGEGTGMGLALCHRIVEAHDGHIEVRDGSGRGAILVMRLPCAERESRFPRLSRRADDHAAGCRILVVDDEYDVGHVIAEVLEQAGHAVETVGSGGMALERLKRQRFDVILSDIRMPGMDGPSFYRVLTDSYPEQVEGLAFITGDTLSPWVRDFLDASERPYLEKPLVPSDLIELVDLLTRRSVS
ncbi:MAG: ATP-binding protein, partial [Alphaproteobacteria bacterium]|nr:ATP-binding protein [Alphaproteobacteria bacterium]